MSLHEEKLEKAARLGLVLIYPEPNELFLDLDSEQACRTFWEHASIFAPIIETFRFAPSASGKSWRFHVTVTLTRAVFSRTERIMLQALLGSDLLHEALCWREAALDGLDAPTVFFERRKAL